MKPMIMIAALVAGLVALPAFGAVGDSPNYQVINYNSAMCLDVSGRSTANGARVHQWTCHRGTNQQWRMVPDWLTDGYFMIVAAHSNKCLDVAGASTANGAKVHQWACHNGANQHWSVAGPGGGFPVPGNRRYHITNRHSGKCLEVAGSSTSRGAIVRQATCGPSRNQLWLVAFP